MRMNARTERKKRGGRARAFALCALCLCFAGCNVSPAWENLPEVAAGNLPKRVAAEAAQAPFDALAYIDTLLGGGHTVDGNTLRLSRDVVVDRPLYLCGMQDICIDLNGFSIRYDKPEGEAGQAAGQHWICVIDGGDVRIRSSGGSGEIYTMDTGDVAALTVMGHASLSLENVSLQARGYGGCGLYVTDGSFVEISGGVFGGDCGLFADDPGSAGTTLRVEGGSFGGGTAAFGAYFKDTVNATLNGGTFSGTLADLYAQGAPYVEVRDAVVKRYADAAKSGWSPRFTGTAWQSDAAADTEEEA